MKQESQNATWAIESKTADDQIEAIFHTASRRNNVACASLILNPRDTAADPSGLRR